MDRSYRLDLGDETWIHTGEIGFPAADLEHEPSIRVIFRDLQFTTDQAENLFF